MDIFGIGEGEKNARSELGHHDSDGEQEEIVAISPAFPGWFACYQGTAADEVIAFPLCNTALVDIDNGDDTVRQEIRHYVGVASGKIIPATRLSGFVCVVGPGQDPAAVARAVLHERRSKLDA